MWFGWALPFENTHLILLGILFFPTLIFYIYRKFRPQSFVWKRKTLLFYPKVGLIIFFLIGLTSYFALASTFDFVVVVKLMLIYFLAHTILLLVFFFIAFLQISKKRDVSERLDIALGFFSKYGLIFSGSIGFWGVPMVDRLIRKARFSDHECSHCHKIMTAKTDLITGKNENNFLDQQQRLEQTYEGLDYDVWKCTTCKNLSLYPIKLEKEGVEDCPKCQRRTFKYIRTQVLIAASVHQPGKGCNEFRCGSCQHQLKMTYEIPIISDSPSVSTRYHGFSGGTSGGSGTGWGGGRSGGGGAGGSW